MIRPLVVVLRGGTACWAAYTGADPESLRRTAPPADASARPPAAVDVATLPRVLDRLGTGWRAYVDGPAWLSRFDGEYPRPERFDRLVPIGQFADDVVDGRLAAVSFVELAVGVVGPTPWPAGTIVVEDGPTGPAAVRALWAAVGAASPPR